MYEHLNLKAWPFQVVPDQQSSEVWAGRRATREQLDLILQAMQATPRSRLHTLWANLGMGKTHTLLHLHYLCRQTKGRLIPVYVPTPRGSKGFIDVYRAIIPELPYDLLSDQLVKVGNSTGGSVANHQIFSRAPGVVSALLAIRSGDGERESLARQWLRAQPGLSSRDLRLIGVTTRIATSEDAINALTALTRLATFKPPTSTSLSRLVLMLDEFQCIAELRSPLRADINGGIHRYFNGNATGLEIFLSFSFGREENVAFLLSPELRSRCDPRSISLDVLNEAEAVAFIRDLLAQYRIRQDERWAYPFAPEAVEALIRHISRTRKLTPRRLVQYANYVLEEWQADCSQDDHAEISAQQVNSYLSDPRMGTMDTDPSET